MISETIKVLEKTQIIHLLLTFQLSSFKKMTPKFIGKHHLMIHNLNQVSFYERNSATFVVKSECRERKGFREVSKKSKKDDLKENFKFKCLRTFRGFWKRSQKV